MLSDGIIGMLPIRVQQLTSTINFWSLQSHDVLELILTRRYYCCSAHDSVPLDCTDILSTYLMEKAGNVSFLTRITGLEHRMWHVYVSTFRNITQRIIIWYSLNQSLNEHRSRGSAYWSESSVARRSTKQILTEEAVWLLNKSRRHLLKEEKTKRNS